MTTHSPCHTACDMAAQFTGMPRCQYLAGQAHFCRNVPIQSAENSSTVIGHVEVTARSCGYKHWEQRAAALTSGDQDSAVHGSRKSTAGCPLVQTAPMDPGAWPSNSQDHVVLVLHTILLQPCMLHQKHSSLQVFWNLLDSVVNAHSEATQEVEAIKGSIELGHAVIYNVSANDPDKQCARVCHVVQIMFRL